MNNVVVSIVVPGIRTHLWEGFFESCKLACADHKFEVVMIGPFNPPESLLKERNFKYIKDYASVPVCIQKATDHCEGELLYHTVDDGVLYPHSLDEAIGVYHNLGPKDVMNMRYTEGVGSDAPEMAPQYWVAGTHADLRLPGINPGWGLSLQPLMRKSYFKELGGLDCRFNYSNHSHHDLAFRIQEHGGRVYQSPKSACNADHMPGRTGDHGPINIAQHDYDDPEFIKMYQAPPTDRIFIDFNNWENQPKVWSLRFDENKLPESYEDLNYV